MGFVSQAVGVGAASAQHSTSDALIAIVVSSVDTNLKGAGWAPVGGEQTIYVWWAPYKTRVWWRRPGSSGTVTASSVDPAGTVALLRYSSVSADIVGAHYRTQSEPPVFPSVGSGDGTAVRIGVMGDPSLPAGTAQRVYDWPLMVGDSAASGGAAYALGAGGVTSGHGWTLLLPSAPAAATPVLIKPDKAAQKVSTPIDIVWQTVPGQKHYVIRRTAPGGAVSYWQGSGWTTSYVTRAGGGSAVSVTSGAGTWTFSVRAIVSPTASEWSSPKTVVLAGDPSPATVSVSSWTTRSPTVTVSGTPGASATITGYRLQVTDSANDITIFESESGVFNLSGLPNGYTIFGGQVIQNGDHVGPFGVANGTINVPPVPKPTVTAVAIYHTETIPPGSPATAGLPGVRLSITSSVAGPVEVSRDGQILHAGDITTALDVDDFTLGSEYRVRVGDISRSPIEWSDWVIVPLPSTVSQDAWLVPVQAPHLAVRACPVEDAPEIWDTQAVATRFLGDPEEHLTFGASMLQAGGHTLVVESDWERERMLEALRSNGWLRYRFPDRWDGTVGRTDRFRVVSPVTVTQTRYLERFEIQYSWVSQTS